MAQLTQVYNLARPTLECSQQFVPKTNISLGVNFLNRTDAFGLTSISTQYGHQPKLATGKPGI